MSTRTITLPAEATGAPVSRRTVVGAAAWAVPAIAVTTSVPAYAASGDDVITVSSPDGTLAAADRVTLTVSVKSAQGAPRAGAPVSLTGPASATFGAASGTTDGAGVFSTTVDLKKPWMTPGSTAIITAVSASSAAPTSFVVLGSNMYEASGTFVQSARAFPSPVVQIASGYAGATAAVLADGSVWTRGGVGPGNAVLLGDGSTSGRSTFKKVPSLAGAVEVVSGTSSVGYFLVRLSNGQVWGWGWNGYGNLGDGSMTTRSTPVRMQGVDDAVGLAANNGTSFVVRRGGSLWACGANNDGSAGVGVSTNAAIGLTQVVDGTNVVSVCGRFGGGCFAKSDGSVWSWGGGSRGYVGDGTAIDRSSPVKLTALADVVSVSAGRGGGEFDTASMFAVTLNGNVWGWGLNDAGQLGTSAGGSSSVPVLVSGATDVSQIFVSKSVTALKKDGSILVWGATEMTGVGTTSTPTAVPLPRRVARLTATASYSPIDNNIFLITAEETLALDVADSVVAAGTASTVTATVTSSGSSEAGSAVSLTATAGAVLGAASGTTSSSGVFQTTVTSDVWTRPGTTVTVTASTDFADRNDSVTVLGSNMYEKGGSFVQSARELPAPVVQIASGWAGSTVAVLADGTVWTRGGSPLLLGDGSSAGRSTFGKVPGVSSAVEVVAGAGNDAFFLVRLSNGQVWGWGDNTYGALGDGTTTDQATPVQMQGVVDAAAIAAGTCVAFILRADATLWAIGYNAGTMAGVGSGVPVGQMPLTPVVNGTNVASVCGRLRGGYLAKKDGSVWAWGRGTGGYIGDGQTERRGEPVKLDGLSDVVSVSTGLGGSDWEAATIFAVTSAGKVWGWGRNDNGQLGNATGTDSSVPILVSGATGVKQILVTRSVTALRNDGSVLVWGATELDGIGTTSTPTSVPLSHQIERLTTNAYIAYNNDIFLITAR